MFLKNHLEGPLFLAVMVSALLVTGGCEATGEDANGAWEVITCNPLLRSLEMESTWAAAKAVGVKGIEIAVDSDLSCSRLMEGSDAPYRLDTPENAKALRKAAEAHGLKTPIACAPINADFGGGETSAPAWAKTLIENAPDAGVKIIYFPIITGSFGKPSVDDDVFVRQSVSLLKELVAHGKKHGVAVGIENLSVYWNRPEVTRPVLEAFTADELNLCLDPINFYWFGHPRSKIYDIVEEFAPRSMHFHAKNVAHPEGKREVVREPGWQYGKNSVPVAAGDLDFGKLLKMMHKAGYSGYVSIEDDSLGHYETAERVGVLRQDVEHLRGIIRRL